MKSSPQALIGLMKRYDKGIHLTDGEIIYCLNDIERYERGITKEMINGIPEVNNLWSKLVIFRANLLAEKRLRIIDKVVG